MKKLLLILIVCTRLNGMESLANNPFILRMMLAAGVLSPDKLNTDGTTLLHRAATIKDTRHLQLLLQYSNQVDMPDHRAGWTALHYASLSGNHIFIRLLAQAGASVNGPTSPTSQNRPLHITTHLLHLETTKTLLDVGADPDVTNIYDQTPLHETCLTPQPTQPAHRFQIASLLVSRAMQNGKNRDAYVLAQDKYGKKASDYLGNGEEELKEFLLPEFEYNHKKFCE